MNSHIVDVAVNVLGKPIQTALALFSLLAYSGRFIDRIYFIEEPEALNQLNSAQNLIRKALGDRLVCYRPAVMNWCYAMDPSRLTDSGYRHALRYQYAFEHTDKRYLLVMHNDCEFTADVVGYLLGELHDHAGVGEIGQCWICPARYLGRCSPGGYRDYRPDFVELAALYAALDPSIYRRKYLEEPTEELKRHPWPLPECRLNEFCCLLRMDIVRPVTCPQGPARPFGAYVDVGNPQTGNGILDIGVAWFGDLVRQGYMFGHVPLSRHVRHTGGHKALFDPDLYVREEAKALDILSAKYGQALPDARG